MVKTKGQKRKSPLPIIKETEDNDIEAHSSGTTIEYESPSPSNESDGKNNYFTNSKPLRNLHIKGRLYP